MVKAVIKLELAEDFIHAYCEETGESIDLPYDKKMKTLVGFINDTRSVCQTAAYTLSDFNDERE